MPAGALTVASWAFASFSRCPRKTGWDQTLNCGCLALLWNRGTLSARGPLPDTGRARRRVQACEGLAAACRSLGQEKTAKTSLKYSCLSAGEGEGPWEQTHLCGTRGCGEAPEPRGSKSGGGGKATSGQLCCLSVAALGDKWSAGTCMGGPLRLQHWALCLHTVPGRACSRRVGAPGDGPQGKGLCCAEEHGGIWNQHCRSMTNQA